MNDDQRLLASAALDGVATSEERARAEGDPEVAAEIERLRAVRAALQVDTAPDDVRREASIAAALAAFDEQSGRAAPPRSSTGRRRWMAPLAAAAAVAAIAAGAVVAVQRDGSDDSADLASTAQSAATESAVADAVAGGEAETSPQLAESQDGTDAAEQPAAPPAATSPTSRAPQLTVAQPAAVETLRTSDDLAAYAQRTIELDGAPTPDASTCAAGRSLGTAYYVVDGSPVLVEVFEVAEPREVVAVEFEQCAVVARAPLP